MPENENPNGQTPPPASDAQTDYKSQFLDLSSKIANGEYVPKNVYTGLQTKHEKEVLAHKADVDALQLASQKASDLETTLKTVQGQTEGLQTQFTTTSTELTQIKAKADRQQLIMNKFPQLVAFEAGGLLPNAPLDQLEGILTTFSEKLGGLELLAKQDKVAGATAVPGQKNLAGDLNSKQLLDKANILAREGKFAEYNTVMDDYYKSLKQPA